MEAVGRLVRVDPDQPGLGAVDRTQERRRARPAELLRERLLERPVPVRPERAAAPDEVLPGPALRLVHAERRGAGERRPHQASTRCRARRGRAPPRAASTRSTRGRRPVPRRQPDVAVRERRAERVRGRIDPPRALVEAERRRRPLGERCCWRSESRRRGTTRPPAGAAATSSVSAGRSTAKTSRTSAVVIPGS